MFFFRSFVAVHYILSVTKFPGGSGKLHGLETLGVHGDRGSLHRKAFCRISQCSRKHAVGNGYFLLLATDRGNFSNQVQKECAMFAFDVSRRGLRIQIPTKMGRKLRYAFYVVRDYVFIHF